MPTIFGEYLLQRGKPVLQDIQMMERYLSLLQGLESGKRVIGSGPLSVEISVGKAVARFTTKFPNVNVLITHHLLRQKIFSVSLREHFLVQLKRLLLAMLTI